MKGQDIVKQLAKTIPKFTSGFSVSVGISSIVPSGTAATLTAESAHGLADGDLVSIIGALAPANIDTASFVRTGSAAQFMTLEDHDLTLSELDKATGGKVITISGATEGEFNGEFQLLRVVNRRELIIAVADSGPTTISGSPIVENANGGIFSGDFEIFNTTATTFDYTLPVSYAVDAFVDNAELQTELRIGHVLSIDRFVGDIYTKKALSSDVLAVVLGDVSISKRRDENTDAVTSTQGEYAFTPTLIQPFAIYVIQNASDDLGGGSLRDKIESEYRPAIYAAVARAKFDTGFTYSQFNTTPTGDGVFLYGQPDAKGPAVYVHEFVFEQLTLLSKEDMVDTDASVAMRDVEFTLTTNLGTGEMTASADLDEEPLP